MQLRTLLLAFIAVIIAGCITPVGAPVAGPVTSVVVGSPPPPPHVGDVTVYRALNAYNSEPRGDIQYRVDKVDPNYVFVSVTTSSPYAGVPHNEVYTPDGNWLRHPVVNHDRQVEYDFAPPYPAYPFPLDFGRTWSMRVNASDPATRRVVSVRVDGRVVGAERIMTPAGAFDTIKITRRVYAGDFDSFLRETNIEEVEWYSPGLGRSVRMERNSNWIDTSRSGGGEGGLLLRNDQLMRGDWTVYELVSYPSRLKAGELLERR
jgi:hypothetical protein